MYTGTVKWFNNVKGFGFIISSDFDEDLFAHYSAILVDGYKSLKAGQAVEFETKPGDSGIHAVNIKPVSELESQESEAL
ncbi:cold shock domain-containing protein [Amphritea sp. HPY]|uniref:cold shock domain-containing protein n=1 Tax=Amphritea sp. HPY TaxID=3421652 RepID=UPI003D7CD0D0